MFASTKKYVEKFDFSLLTRISFDILSQGEATCNKIVR